MRVDALLHDLVISVRMLRRAPAFALTVIATIALGIGSISLVLAVFSTVVWHALPFPAFDQLVVIGGHSPAAPNFTAPLTLPEVEDLRARSRTIAGFAAYRLGGSVNLSGAGATERIRPLIVSGDFFATLVAPPLLGRTFTTADAEPGQDRVVILSEPVWREHFGGDPQAIGRSVRLNDQSYVIIGVMPASFEFPHRYAQIWLPQTIDARALQNESIDRVVVARLHPGVGLAAANDEVRAIGARLAERRSGHDREVTFAVENLRDSILGSTTTILWMLFGTVLFVLLTAVANVAGLLILRSASRQRETAVRRALGASGLDIVRRFVTESLLLSVAGGTLGVFFAIGGARVLRVVGPASVPRLRQVEVDASILGIALALCLLAALTVTLAPALRAMAADLTTALRIGATASQTGFGLRRGHRSQQALALCQIAIVVVFVTGFGLFARSLWSLLSVDLGFDPHHVLAVQIETGMMTPPVYEQLLTDVRAVPGVESATYSWLSPQVPGGMTMPQVAEQGNGTWTRTAPIAMLPVGNGYFDLLRISMTRGRAFTADDMRIPPCTTIVNESLARAAWPGEDPVGRRLAETDVIGTRPASSPDRNCRVIGVAHDVRDRRLTTAAQPEMYVPITHWSGAYGSRALLVRTRDDASASAASILQAIRLSSPLQQPQFVMAIDHMIELQVIEPRFYTVLFGAFAGLATLLAAVGVYGISAYAASRRTREIGIRLVLGARRGQIVGLVVRGGAIVSGLGVLIGMGVAAAASRVLASLLFEVTPLDPVTFVATPLLVVVVSLLAGYLPARRAARLEPGDVLRAE